MFLSSLAPSLPGSLCVCVPSTRAAAVAKPSKFPHVPRVRERPRRRRVLRLLKEIRLKPLLEYHHSAHRRACFGEKAGASFGGLEGC